MNILIHTGDPYPADNPATKRILTFYNAFVAQGHSVKVLAPSDTGERKKHTDVFVCPTIHQKKKNTFYRFLNNFSFGISSFFVGMKTGHADVVITTSPPALSSPFGWMIARFKHAKLVYDVRDIWPDIMIEMGSISRKSFYYIVFAGIRNFMLHHTDLITVVSEGKIQKLLQYNPKSPIVHIPNGFDALFLENKEDPEVIQTYQLDERFSCVYIGNLGAAQGLLQLLQLAEKAQKETPEVQFLLFGSGVDENLLKKYVKDKALNNVAFPGRISNREIYTVLRHAKMSFVSLVNEKLTDSIPTKMFEALGTGCPVLLSAVGDAEKVLQESKLGISVKPNDAEALWNAFLKMYQNIAAFEKYKTHAQNLMLTKYSRQHAAICMEKELKKRFEK